jgi:hypothetical protein
VLIDRLAPLVDHIFVLHDFDISGFTIRGTLGKDSDRYTFANDLSAKIIDIGLRLADVQTLGLDAEPVKLDGDREAYRKTLEGYGATEDEIEFLVPEDEDEPCRRVELNAMTSRQLVDFVEEAFAQHGVEKVVPGSAVIREHARHLIESRLSAELLAQHADAIAAEAAAVELPADLLAQLLELVDDEPELAWDEALGRLL